MLLFFGISFKSHEWIHLIDDSFFDDLLINYINDFKNKISKHTHTQTHFSIIYLKIKNKRMFDCYMVIDPGIC